MTQQTFVSVSHPVLVLSALLSSGSVGAEEAPWKIADAPLITKWAKTVTPENVRKEYPRPLMVRKEWQSLNGIWQFAFDDNGAGSSAGWSSGRDFQDRILVPFTYEAALSGIGKGKEIHERVWYRRMFSIPKNWDGRNIRLNFGAVDWEATVYVNGKQVGTHVGGYAPFSFDITDALKPGQPQEIVVAVFDPADPRKNGYQPKGKQLGSEGIWYTRTTGIWQSVWIEPVNKFHITNIQLDPIVSPDGTQGILHGKIVLNNIPGGYYLEFEISRNGKLVNDFMVLQHNAPAAQTQEVEWTGEKSIVDTPTLWSPATPSLYDIKVTLKQLDSLDQLKQGGKTVDQVKTYTAFRTVGMKDGRLTLNGKPIFYRGVLDQGYWPDGILTPPSDAAIKADVELVKKLGFNMARKHVKVDDPRWYYWCDKLGVLVWQDMPSSHNLSSEEAQQNFIHEWREVMAATRNYPSVVHWIPFNENWGNPEAFQDSIVTLTRQIDSSRPITDASGWTQRGLTDVIDTHDYSNNLRAQGVRNPTKPKVVGEYGGIALPIEGHTWSSGWGYQSVRDADGLINRIRYQTTQLFEAENLSGFVYTQLTDVEQELNGLLTYDRLPKAPFKRIEAVFNGTDRSTADEINFIKEWLVLGPVPGGTTLNAAVDNAENRAQMETLLSIGGLSGSSIPDPKDGEPQAMLSGEIRKWKRVAINEDTLDFHKVFGGNTENSVAYAVAIIDSPKATKNATLYLGSDDGVAVTLNGVEVWRNVVIRGVSLDSDIVPNITLKKGRNVLVFRVGQGMGGWGLAARVEMPR